jgi:hypothetical protein
MYVSRISSAFGEPLYGVAAIPAAEIDLLIDAGNTNSALINPEGALKYTADLMPDNLDPAGLTGGGTAQNPYYRPPLGVANDIIYGGLGDDSIHGGAGDDAISGAEAPTQAYTNNYDQNGNLLQADLRSDFFHPLNPGNVLGYNPIVGDPRFTVFALYDQNNGLREVLLTPVTGARYTGAIDPNLQNTVAYHNWLLNFDYTEGPVDSRWIGGSTYAGVATDGNDMLFGDLQHDWVMGGTGRDLLFLGWGDDVGNADDQLNTNNGLNDLPETNPSYEDLIYGGGGVDVLIGNTGGDRLFDWSGEFNMFIGPFNPYGEPTTSRNISPSLEAYLYQLSKSAGADQTLAALHGGPAARNGEPYGELGLVTQSDPQWGDQKGGSRDPQPGPAHGSRDVRVFAGTQSIQAPGTTGHPSVATINVTASDAAGAEQGLDPVVFQVSRIGQLDIGVAISISWSGTATRNTDYTVTAIGGTLAANGLTLTLPVGSTGATVTITPINDATAESGETVILTLNANAAYRLGPSPSATGTILDNDGTPSVSIAGTDASAAEEGSDPITFTITRNGNPNASITVNLTWGGTAAFPADYAVAVAGGTLSANRAQLSLSAGATMATITITPVDDAAVEPTETVTLTVATGTGYTVGSPSSASGTIADNDTPVVSASSTDASGAEQGSDPITFTVTRNASTGTSITINLAWNGTATLGTDYTVTAVGGTLSANSLQLTLGSGVTTATVTVTPVNDISVEPMETVTLTIAAGTGYTVGTSSASGSIVDNDVASLSVADFTVTEGNNNTTTINISITLSAPVATGVTFTISTAEGTALAGSDFQAKTSTLTMAAGATQVVFQVAIVNDRVAESTETFTVTIAPGSVSPSSVLIAKGTGTVTIIDNDNALTASVAAPRPAVGAPLSAAEISAALAGARAVWVSEGLDTSGLAGVSVRLVDLPGAELAIADGNEIRLDIDAAGWGWTATGGRIDLTTVLAHELGHLLGFNHDDATQHPVMAEILVPLAITSSPDRGRIITSPRVRLVRWIGLGLRQSHSSAGFPRASWTRSHGARASAASRPATR